MIDSAAPWYLKNPKLSNPLDSPKSSLWEINQAYYDGLHFKAGNNLFWIGALPDFMPTAEYTYILTKLEKLFTSHNKIKECINRYLDAIFSNEVFISHTNKEIETFINNWQKEILDNSYTTNTDEVEDCFTVALRNALVLGEGYIRLFIRDEYKDPLNKIAAHSPHPSRIKLLYNSNGLLEAIQYMMVGSFESSKTKYERQVLDFSTGLTTFYLYESEEDFEEGNFLEAPYTLDLNYSFTIHRVAMPSMVSESIKNLQNAINLVLTMSVSNTVDAGFLERIILNAQLPGEFVRDAQGREQFVPFENSYRTGTGVVNFLSGIPLEDSEGNITGLTNPSVNYKPPIDTSGSMLQVESLSKLLYLEFNQGHVIASDSAGMSGESRIQLKQDYDKTLKRLSRSHKALIMGISRVVTYLLQKVKGLAVSESLKARDSLTLDYVIETNLLPTEVQQVRDNFINKLVSHRTSLIHLGFNDPDLELKQINKENSEELQMLNELTLEQIPVSEEREPPNN